MIAGRINTFQSITRQRNTCRVASVGDLLRTGGVHTISGVIYGLNSIHLAAGSIGSDSSIG